MGNHYQNAVNAISSALQQNEIELDTVSNQNEDISPLNLIQQNEKQVKAIYLSTIARGVDTFTPTQTAILYNISHQCPYSGGKYVYFARTLYDNIEKVYYDDTLLCQETQPLILGSSDFLGNDKIKNSIEIYPNPANESVNLLFLKSLKSNIVNIEVYNLIGERIMHESKLLPLTEKKLTFNMKDIPNGMYQFKISSGKEIIQFKNVVIIK